MSLLWQFYIYANAAVGQVLKPIIYAIQPLLVPVCLVSAWAIVILVAWSLWTAVRDTAIRTRQLHQIPCSNCRFFTSNYHLKCTVHPAIALTEEAINCSDYAPVESDLKIGTGN